MLDNGIMDVQILLMESGLLRNNHMPIETGLERTGLEVPTKI